MECAFGAMGAVYSRKRSPYLWIKHYQHGRPVRESTGTKNEVVARRMLRAREGDVERGIPIDPKVGQRGGSDIATARGKNCQSFEGRSQPARSIAS
jgi:hypothetical protein